MASDFQQRWAGLTEAQKQRVREKAQWEHMSLSAVLREWPNIIEPEHAAPGDTHEGGKAP